MTALRQLQLVILATTLGAIIGSLVLLSRDDLRPVAVAATAGVVLLVLTLAARPLLPARAPGIGGLYSFRLGQVLVTFAGVAAVVFALNLLARPEARGTSAPVSGQSASPPASSAPASSAPASSAPASSSAVPNATPAPTPPPPESVAPATSASVSPATSAPTTPSPAVTDPPAPTQTASQSPQSPSPTPTPTPAPLLPTLPALPTLPPLPTATIRLP